MTNPWNLTEGHAQALDALCEHHCNKLAAVALGISDKAFENRLHRLRVQMGTRCRLSHVLLWHAWRLTGKVMKS